MVQSAMAVRRSFGTYITSRGGAIIVRLVCIAYTLL
jgi:hypothetical protein